MACPSDFAAGLIRLSLRGLDGRVHLRLVGAVAVSQDPVPGNIVVELRRAGLHRVHRPGDVREVLVLDRDVLGSVLGDDRGFGHHAHHRLAHVARLARCQGRADGLDQLRAVPRFAGNGIDRDRFDARGYHVLAGEDQVDALGGLGGRGVDGDYLGVGAVRADEVGVELAGDVAVGGVAAGAGDVAVVFEAAFKVAGGHIWPVRVSKP